MQSASLIGCDVSKVKHHPDYRDCGRNYNTNSSMQESAAIIYMPPDHAAFIQWFLKFSVVTFDMYSFCITEMLH